MIDALIAGKVHGTPTERMGKSGKPFALAKIRTATTDGESRFVSVIAFDAAPVAALLALWVAKSGQAIASKVARSIQAVSTKSGIAGWLQARLPVAVTSETVLFEVVTAAHVTPAVTAGSRVNKAR